MVAGLGVVPKVQLIHAAIFRTAQLINEKRVLRSALIAGTLLAITVGPAAAEDCFVRVRLADGRPAVPRHVSPPHLAAHVAAAVARPHLVHRIHHIKRPLGLLAIKPVAAAAKAPAPLALPHRQYLESSLAMRSIPVYALRPVACDTHPSGIQSVEPGRPATAQKLLDALAGPTPSVAPQETVTPTIAGPDLPGLPGGPGLPDETGGPGFPGFPGGTGGFPVVVGPLMPPITPPMTPPDQPPAIPEPATWAMLILGFFALGGALRGQRKAAKIRAEDR
jgi:hypothetical protein